MLRTVLRHVAIPAVMVATGGAALVSEHLNTPAPYTPPPPAVALRQLLSLDGQKARACRTVGRTVHCTLVNGGHCTQQVNGEGRCDIPGRVDLIIGSDSRPVSANP